MLTAEEQKWAHIWRQAHEIAAEEMPRIASGVCRQPGLASTLAIFAMSAVKAEREHMIQIIDEMCGSHNLTKRLRERADQPV